MVEAIAIGMLWLKDISVRFFNLDLQAFEYLFLSSCKYSTDLTLKMAF